MGFEEKLRQWQDAARDAEWRIKTIPWQRDRRPEYVYNTPLTLVTGFGGVLIFIGAIVLVVKQIVPLWFLGVGVGGLVIGILGRVYAAWYKYRRWHPVQAVCVDREVRECEVPNKGDLGTTTVWEFRVLCELSHQEQHYCVTPVPTHTVAFGSQSRLEKYLNGTIAPDNSCTVWINPDNPLQCCFHKRPKI